MAEAIWRDPDPPQLHEGGSVRALRFASALLADRRVRVGHSTQTLAHHLGVTPSVVRAVEGGADPSRYEYGLLDRYAEALGLEVPELFEDDALEARAQDDDVAVVVSLVANTGGRVQLSPLCEALGWSPERVRAALDAAPERLALVGLRLVAFGDAAVELVGTPGQSGEVVSLSARSVESYGLNSTQAKLVYELSGGGKKQRSETPGTQQLLDAEIIEYDQTLSNSPKGGVRAAVRLSKKGRFDLCLD